MEKIFSKRTKGLAMITAVSTVLTAIHTSSMKETVNLVVIGPPTVSIFNK